jgi:hypothetical protein
MCSAEPAEQGGELAAGELGVEVAEVLPACSKNWAA